MTTGLIKNRLLWKQLKCPLNDEWINEMSILWSIIQLLKRMTLNFIKQLWNAWNMTLSKRNMFKWWHDDYDVKSSLKSGWKEIFQKGNLYWLGQKVHLGFSIPCYRKTQTNFLANSIFVFSLMRALFPSLLMNFFCKKFFF